MTKNNVKKIIWLYYEGNDLKDLSFELNNSVLQKYLTDLDFSQNLKEKQRFIDEKLNIHLNEYIKGQEKNDKKYSLINYIKHKIDKINHKSHKLTSVNFKENIWS